MNEQPPATHVSTIDETAAKLSGVSITTEIKRGEETVLTIISGETADGATRYLEFRSPNHQRSVRAEVKKGTMRLVSNSSEIRFRLTVDNSISRNMVYKDGMVYEEAYVTDGVEHKAFSLEPYDEGNLPRENSFLAGEDVREALRPFWGLFKNIDTTNLPTIEPWLRQQISSGRFKLSEWAGCVADITSAGVAIGGALGFSLGKEGAGWAGAVSGAGTGGAIGAYLGSAVGLGWCTAEHL